MQNVFAARGQCVLIAWLAAAALQRVRLWSWLAAAALQRVHLWSYNLSRVFSFPR